MSVIGVTVHDRDTHMQYVATMRPIVERHDAARC